MTGAMTQYHQLRPSSARASQMATLGDLRGSWNIRFERVNEQVNRSR
jgi:hypothetical protein